MLVIRLATVLVVLGLASGLVTGGCGDDSHGRHAISGMVTVDGTPLAAGNISFQPMEGQASSGGSVISAGKFLVPSGGGLLTGKYRVVVHAPLPGTGGQASAGAPGEPPMPPSEMIPADWNKASEHFIDVREQGPFTFEFPIATRIK